MKINRRELLKISGAAAVLPLTRCRSTTDETMLPRQRPRVAAIITEYRRNSHADVIVGRLLEGYDHDGIRHSPRVEVISMFTDQVPDNDMSRALAEKHGYTIMPSIPDALLMGGDDLAVDGVVLIGEHGDYPLNDKGQKLYPRYELFSQIVEVFRESGRSVPVFCDKHLSVEWEKAKWMYDQSIELDFPFLAGSSLPLTWRRPPLELELDTPVDYAVAAFYGGKESYGFHALETLQCMVERRQGGETGIEAVQCLEGPDVWTWTNQTAWAGELLEAALERSATRQEGTPRDNVDEPIVFLLDYRNGLRAAVYILNGHIRDAVFSASLTGQEEPLSTLFWLQSGRPYSHFSNLTFQIEEMIVNGKANYPVERTLLTTGVLAALMDSSFQGGVRVETPHLDVSYTAPADSLFSRGPVPALEEQA